VEGLTRALSSVRKALTFSGVTSSPGTSDANVKEKYQTRFQVLIPRPQASSSGRQQIGSKKFFKILGVGHPCSGLHQRNLLVRILRSALRRVIA
jgi:hypothetical protein